MYGLTMAGLEAAMRALQIITKCKSSNESHFTVPAAPRFFLDASVSTIVAGFVAMMTGYTSSLVLMFQAGQAAHLIDDAQISSWIWTAVHRHGAVYDRLVVRYRAPIVSSRGRRRARRC